MKTVYVVFSEELGEVEGIFDDNNNLLSSWSCNDACWRNEYFSGFLKKLGVNVRQGELTQERLNKLAAQWGEEEISLDE